MIYILSNVCKEMTDVTLLLLDSNTWNYSIVYKKWSILNRNIHV